tara:strand:+ start:880 stop:984 length:105 start_codon:yes stop_codon:yes gene_type:complete
MTVARHTEIIGSLNIVSIWNYCIQETGIIFNENE